MSPATAALLIEYIAIPLVRELAARRGAYGVNKKDIEDLGKDPERVLNTIKNDPGLQTRVIEALADGIDNVGSSLIDAVFEVFKAYRVLGEQDGNDT